MILTLTLISLKSCKSLRIPHFQVIYTLLATVQCIMASKFVQQFGGDFPFEAQQCPSGEQYNGGFIPPAFSSYTLIPNKYSSDSSATKQQEGREAAHQPPFHQMAMCDYYSFGPRRATRNKMVYGLLWGKCRGSILEASHSQTTC